MIKIRADSDGGETLFLHLRDRLVNVGQRVSRAQLIAYSGATGEISGPHLHFEFWKDVDPARFGLVATDEMAIKGLPASFSGEWAEPSFWNNPKPPVNDSPFIQHPVIVGDTKWKLGKRYGYPVTATGTEAIDRMIYKRMEDINPQTQGRLDAGQAFNIDKDPMAWYNSVTTPKPVETTPQTPTETPKPPMPKVEIEEEKLPELEKEIENNKDNQILDLITKNETYLKRIDEISKHINQSPKISDKLKSRKLWAMITGIAIAITSVYRPELQSVIMLIISLIGTYIGVQGIDDIVKNQK
jgi:hypothetical protein